MNQISKNIGKTFMALCESVYWLHKRFGVCEDNQTPESCVAFEAEELGELAKAIIEGESKEGIALEMADVFFVLIRHAIIYDLPLEKALLRIADKNWGKTDNNYKLEGYKIVKKNLE